MRVGEDGRSLRSEKCENVWAQDGYAVAKSIQRRAL